MVLLKCENGSRMAIVACRNCARISRQVLKSPYSPLNKTELVREHTCPVCGEKYILCSLDGAIDYVSNFARYNRGAEAYNDSVRDNYAQTKKNSVTEFVKTINEKTATSSQAGESKKNTDALASENTSKKEESKVNNSVLSPTLPKGDSIDYDALWQEVFASLNNEAKVNLIKAGTILKSIDESEFTVVARSAFVMRLAEQNREAIENAMASKLSRYVRMICALAENAATVQATEPVRDEKAEEKEDLSELEAYDKAEAINMSRVNPTRIPVVTDMTTSQSFEYTEEFDRKIDHWKRALLDTGKRNKMINYRETKRSTLKILEPAAEELFNQLAVSEKTLTFQKPVSKDSDIRTYSLLSLLETLSYNLPVTKGDIKTEGTIVERERTLKNLRSKAKLAQEEQGTNILYLCFGFIYWKENNKESSPWIKSPLLMMPVNLGLKSLNAPYTLTKGDDEIEVNPTLDYLFNTGYNINLPAFELKNKSSFAEYLQSIEEIVDRKGWRVVPEVSLGLLSFLKISMYHDLNENREALIGSPVIRAMAGDRNAIGDIPAAAINYDFDKVHPEEWHEVVNSDSSQEEAILLSKMGVSFVMQGPPGTGKSQTITNIIAEGLADGKKILFVSEKSAALEVVLKRLTEVDLDDFCLSLHNYKANKKEIIDSIGANLSLQEEYVGDYALKELTELFHDRQCLNEYADELHQPIEPLGDSIYIVFGKLSQMENASVVEFSLDKPMEISREKYASLLYCVTAFENALHNIEGPLTKNPWYSTKATSSGQNYKQELMNATSNLAEELRELDNIAQSLSGTFKMKESRTWHEIKNGTDEIDKVLALPEFSPEWLDDTKRKELKAANKYEKQEQQKYYKACEAFEEVYETSIQVAPVEKWIEGFGAADEVLKEIGFNVDAEEAIYSKSIYDKDAVKGFMPKLETVAAEYKRANEIVGTGSCDTIKNIESLYAVLDLLNGNYKYVSETWFINVVLKRVQEQLAKAISHAEKLDAAKASIRENWHDNIYELNADEITEYFCSDYSWIYQYEGDVEALLDNEISKAEQLVNRLEDLLIAQTEAYSLLKYYDVDNVDSMTMLCNVLSMVAEAPYMNAEWFDSRKVNEIMPIIEEAISVSDSINEKTAALMEDWEASALAIDVDGMLARFKTEYVGMFRKMKAGYKEDIKTLRLHAKSVGKAFDEDNAIDFLQSIKAINDEKKWFEEHASQLSGALGDRFKGIETDWETVRHSMNVALQIADMFPYSSVSVETIKAIIAITESLQLTGNAKRLAEVLSAESIESCVTDLRECKVLSNFTHTESIKEQTIPLINAFIKNCSLQRPYIQQFKNTKKTPSLTHSEIRTLLDNLVIVRSETNWFDENRSLHDELFVKLNDNENSDWKAISDSIDLVSSIKSVFNDGIVPTKTIQYVCDIENRDERLLERVACLSPESISEIHGFMQKTVPHLNQNEMPISAGILSGFKKYAEAGELVESIVRDANQYCVEDEISAEIHKPYLMKANIAKKQREAIISRSEHNLELFKNKYVGIDTDWDTIEKELEKVDIFCEETFNILTEDAVKMVCNDAEVRSMLQTTYAALKDLVVTVVPKISYFQTQFDGVDFAIENLETVASRYEACLHGFSELNKWLDYVETREECDKNGLADFTAKIVAEDNAVKDVCSAFEKGFYSQWINLALDTIPAVQSFRRRVHEQRISRFIKTDEKQFELARRRIRQRIISTYPNVNQITRAGSELGILRHEMEKKRRIMPLRKLFKSIPNLLLTLKPCLMMSPLSVAYFLEAGLYNFDMVIFDEASQIFPEDAIGAIYRAKQVIIAGDTKQLPPTSFFASSTGNSEQEYDDDESYYDEIYDSILEETANILPNRTLLWHYRSKHEHLIAFSNKEIYKNELVTFPSSNEKEKDTGVEFVYVEDGYFERGGRNCNVQEAKRCVELVKEHIEKYPNRSLGIIAFSEKQQNAIALEIQKFREKNPKYEEFFAEGKEDEFFVKNLENVQGDERDTIFFSVGYARTKEQKANNKPMTMNFGPLGKQGGERRLNVAITRSRKNIKLVSSILPSDIDLNRTESEGVRMLRSYIEFAMNGDAVLAASRSVVKPDEFVNAIAEFLRIHGYKVSQHVGCSGYKIDIAVEHPSELIQQFVAGIECDGFSYAAARTTRDRDRLRGSVLKNMGWNMYRIWSAEWYKNPEVEGEKLLAFINAEIEKCDEKVRIVEEEKRKEEEARKHAEEAQKKFEAALAKDWALWADRARNLNAVGYTIRIPEIPSMEYLRDYLKEDVRKSWNEAVELGLFIGGVPTGRTLATVREERRKAEAEAIKEEKRKLAAKRKAEEEQIRMDLEKQREAERQAKEAERKAKEAEAKAIESRELLSWVIKGAAVKHNSYGIGEVTKLTESHIYISFAAGEKRFVFPDAFEKGFLAKANIDDRSKQMTPVTAPSSKMSKNPNELMRVLRDNQFACIDNRMSSGILWVLYSAEKRELFERVIGEYNVACKLEKRGAVATNNVPAWRVMFN